MLDTIYNKKDKNILKKCFYIELSNYKKLEKLQKITYKSKSLLLNEILQKLRI